jgi:hypothetical protein
MHDELLRAVTSPEPNAFAVPWNVEVITGGTFIFFSMAPIAFVAWPSAMPGAKLKEIVTAGD